MRKPLLVLVWVGCALGCGDNSKECGPGTLDEGGVCVPAADCGFGTRLDEESGECVPDGAVVCSDGTVFDPLTGRCKVDPSACQDGTVLINNACMDPTAGLTIDLQEGPEPNGLGIIEASPAQAGNITLAAAGTAYVVHGTITPWRSSGAGELEPDVDTYVLAVGGPVLVRITADGVHGLTAGFVAVAEVGATDPLVDWKRYGLNLVGDTSQRQVWLPKAGTYRLAIADTRTLNEYLATGSATTAHGGENTDYYVSLTDLGAPPITTLTANTATGTVDGQSVLFYGAPAGTGLNMASVAMSSDAVQASAVAMVNSTMRAIADETSQPARVMFGALAAGDTTYVVVDHVFAISPSPTMYTLSVTTTNL